MRRSWKKWKESGRIKSVASKKHTSRSTKFSANILVELFCFNVFPSFFRFSRITDEWKKNFGNMNYSVLKEKKKKKKERNGKCDLSCPSTEREIRAIVTNDTWLKIGGMKNEPHEDLAARDENINRQAFKSASWLRERQGSFLLKIVNSIAT